MNQPSTDLYGYHLYAIASCYSMVDSMAVTPKLASSSPSIASSSIEECHQDPSKHLRNAYLSSGVSGIMDIPYHLKADMSETHLIQAALKASRGLDLNKGMASGIIHGLLGGAILHQTSSRVSSFMEAYMDKSTVKKSRA